MRIAIAVTLCLAVAARGDNPFVRTNYAADPSAHVFGDRVYVYASHDRHDAKEFDMTDYHVYSSDDLQNWQDHGVVLDVKDVPWGKSHMWAPDAAFKDGTYYFYFCPRPAAGRKGRPIGVATSKHPAGPFVSEPEPIAGCEGIDPSVFIDDDGAAYILWAGKGCQIARLTPDMKALDGEPKQIGGLTRFFEGPWVFKRDGTYYLTYAASYPGGSGSGGNGQNFSYATADSILGPYAYKGAFTRSRVGGNIHGSQVKFGDAWLNFYHDFSTSEGKAKRGFKRGIRVDELEFDKEGNLLILTWTDRGPKQRKPLDPYVTREAETMAACDVPEGPHAITTHTTGTGDGRRVSVGDIDDGDWMRVNGVDFGADGASRVDFTVASPKAGGAIEVRLGALDGPLVARCDVPDSGAWETWRAASADVKGAAGAHDVFFVFRGPASGGAVSAGGGLFNVDSYRFARAVAR